MANKVTTTLASDSHVWDGTAAMGRLDPRTLPNATLTSTPWVVHRFAKPGASPHMCLQCLMIPGVNKKILQDVLSLQVEYARRHGYDLYTFVDEEDRKTTGKSPLWYKIKSTQYLIDSGTTGCDYIFWMDSDTAIMNMSFPLESLIHWNGMEDTDIVVAADTLAVNLAQSLWKFTSFNRLLLDEMWNVGSVRLEETGSINVLLGGCRPQDSLQQKSKCYDIMDRGWRDPTFAREVFYPGDNAKIKELVVNKSFLPHIKWVPKRAINAYPLGVFGGRSTLDDGDFIVHFPSGKGKPFLPKFVEAAMKKSKLDSTANLHSAGQTESQTERGRKDPRTIANATLTSTPWVVHRFAKPGASPHMCLQCLMIPGVNKKILQDVLSLQVEYARRHGYDLYTFVDEEDRKTTGKSPLWYKIKSTQYLIDSGTTGCDYIFWMDSDTAIMNMSFPLESLIHWNGMEDTDIVVAADTLAVNLAQSLWKFTSFNRLLLDEMWNVGSVRLEETGSINVLLGGCRPQDSLQQKSKCYDIMDRGWRDPTFAREVFYPGDNAKIKELVVNKSFLPHIKWVPKRAINAYPLGVFGGRSTLDDGDFIVHFPSGKGKPFLPKFVEAAMKKSKLDSTANLHSAGQTESQTERGRKDPRTIANATLTSTPWVVHRFAKPGASPHMCLQCLMIPGVNKKILQDVLSLQVEYARRHGYDLYTFVDEEDRKTTGKSPLWYKIKSTQYLIDSGTTGCDYIFWMDSDTAIMNMSFPLESLIHWNGMEDTDIVVAADTLAVNLAQSLWKFTSFNRLLLDEMWNVGSVRLEETGSINVLLGGCRPQDSLQQKSKCYDIMDRGWRDPTFAREVFYPGDNTKIKELVVNKSFLPHIKWVPKRAINAYPLGVFGGRSTLDDGDFIVHFPSGKGKPFLPKFVEAAMKKSKLDSTANLHSAGQTESQTERGRKDPRTIANATLTSTPWVVHRFAKPGASPHMCLQCLMIPGVNKKILQDVLSLQVEYARRHGYDLYTFVDEEDRKTTGKSPLWYKIKSTQYLIDSGTTGCDYIFWMDSDTAIMNMSFPLESLIHWNGMEDTDIVVAADTLAVNLAQSLWKFTSFNRLLLDEMWNVGSVRLEETGSINVLLGGCRPQDSLQQKLKCYDIMDRGWRDPTFARDVFYPGGNKEIQELVVNKSFLPHIKWVPKRAINSYPQGLFGGSYELGDPDFLVHCPSGRGKTLLKDLVLGALRNAGLEIDYAAQGREDPSKLPNASMSSMPWVIHRFAKANASPHMCLQCLMTQGVEKQETFDVMRLVPQLLTFFGCCFFHSNRPSFPQNPANLGMGDWCLGLIAEGADKAF